MRAVVVWTLYLALAACGGCAVAPEPRGEHAELEDIFWHCDYVATTQGMDATPVRECAAATRELRRVKFDGSFHRLLAWWRENKSVEHDKRRAARNESKL
jgi:hypothetical protein